MKKLFLTALIRLQKNDDTVTAIRFVAGLQKRVPVVYSRNVVSCTTK